jgi:hypothetical protein
MVVDTDYMSVPKSPVPATTGTICYIPIASVMPTPVAAIASAVASLPIVPPHLGSHFGYPDQACNDICHPW